MYVNHAKFVKRMCIAFYRKRKQQQQHCEETNQVKIQAKMTENLLENWHPHCCICLSLNGRNPDLYVFYFLLFHYSSLITNSLFSLQDFFLLLCRFFLSLPSRRILLHSNFFYLRTESATSFYICNYIKLATLLSLKIKSLLMLNLRFYSNGPSTHLTTVVVTRLQKVAVLKYRQRLNCTRRRRQTRGCHWVFVQRKKLGGITHCDIGGTKKNIAAR